MDIYLKKNTNKTSKWHAEAEEKNVLSGNEHKYLYIRDIQRKM